MAIAAVQQRRVRVPATGAIRNHSPGFSPLRRAAPHALNKPRMRARCEPLLKGNA